jgi:hypothetical protein
MNSQDLHNLQEAYMEVAMNEGKQKYPYAKVTDQLRNKEGDAYRTSKTNPKEGERKEKEHLRHQKIHDRVKNLPYHEIGRTENRLKDSEKDNKPQKYFPNRLRRADGQGIKDSYEYDLYDIILSHLLDEGYADTEQAAEAIMVNMSEDWRESIVEATYKPRGAVEPVQPAGPVKKKMVVTSADKKGGTEAYKRLQAGHPDYVAAPHLK